MPPDPGTPADWLRHARSDLSLARKTGDLGVPADVADAIALTDYAVTTRYPGVYEEVGEDEYRDAMRMAECVMAWVERVI